MFRILKKRGIKIILISLGILIVGSSVYFIKNNQNHNITKGGIGRAEKIVEKITAGKDVVRKTLKISYYFTEQLYLKATKQRCSRPIKYSLGNLDEEFNLSREELLEAIKKAEEVWEKDDDRNFFEYDPEAKFKINLIYDERQKINQEKKLLDKYFEDSEARNEEMEKEYKGLEKEYNNLTDYIFKAVGKLNDDTYAYEMRVIDYNYGLNYKKGTKRKLKKERRDLEARRTKLIKQENYLNSLGAKMNKLAKEGKELAEEYDNKIKEFKEKYKSKEGMVFEEGNYEKNIDRESINIYAFFDIDNLIMILAHEFGHTLGIEHVDNSKSLMYFLNEKQEKGDNMKLTNEDRAALNEVCD
jgi:hypothetical protein